MKFSTFFRAVTWPAVLVALAFWGLQGTSDFIAVQAFGYRLAASLPAFLLSLAMVYVLYWPAQKLRLWWRHHQGYRAAKAKFKTKAS